MQKETVMQLKGIRSCSGYVSSSHFTRAGAAPLAPKSATPVFTVLLYGFRKKTGGEVCTGHLNE